MTKRELRSSYGLKKGGAKRRTAAVLLLGAAVIAATLTTEWKGIRADGLGIAVSILIGLFKPDFGFLVKEVLGQLVQTFFIAFFGTFIGMVLSLPLSFVASRRFTGRHAARFGKNVIALIRAFPEIILAILLIKVLGPGAAAGALAMGIHSVGMLGKLFAEAVDAMDERPFEALASIGGSSWQRLRYVAIPQIAAEFLSIFFYRLEINTRGAAILGIVGAGGIGATLIYSIQLYAWQKVGVTLAAMIVLVIAVDQLSAAVRRRLA
jgi:phosphonate transport system permease protein